LEDLDLEMENNSVWEMIRENIKISAKEGLGYFELNLRSISYGSMKNGQNY
jgi:hypothetical protein